MSEGILRKCQLLIDKAYSTDFPAERDALLAKADQMMMDYSIDQIQILDPSRPNTAASVKATVPELRLITLMNFCDARPDYDIIGAMQSMFQSLAFHFQIRVGAYTRGDAKVVGYPADLDFLEMMFLSLKIHMLTNLDPRVSPDVPWEQTSPEMKQAGLQWEAIHERCQTHPSYPYKEQPFTKSIGLRHYGIYRKWLDAHPEIVPNKARPENWRWGFINSYQDEIRVRLREMREATVVANANLPALLDNKKSLVEEFFLQCFPPPPLMAPSPPTKGRQKMVKYRTLQIPDGARAAGRSVARKADLNSPSSRITRATPKGLG